MRKNIIAIVGDSGCGKTTASLYLQEKFGWNAIVSFTTRHKRRGEINGKDHWFVKEGEVPSHDKMCAYTVFGGYEYWTEWDQFQTLFNSVYVIDEKGLVDLMSKEQPPIPFCLITVKIKRNNREDIDKERIERDKDRITLPDDFYDYIIENNDSLDEFKEMLNKIATTIIKNQE